MRKLINSKSGSSNCPKWSNANPGSDSESEDDIHSAPANSTETAQSPNHEDNENQTGQGGNITRRVSEEAETMYRAALEGDLIAAEILLSRNPNLACDFVTDKTCCYAAVSGVVEIARVMIEKNPNLATAHDENNVTPLHKAALYGNKKMVSYLLESTKIENLSNEEWFDLLLVAISEKMFDVAIELVDKNNVLAKMVKDERTALLALAQMDISNIISTTWRPKLLRFIKLSGNVELLTMVTRAYPQLIWDTDSNGHTIFHIAVAYRQGEVFNLIHPVEAMIHSTTISQDQDGNNILHLCAKLSLRTLDRTRLPPASLMQSELAWFEVTKKVVPGSCQHIRNKDGLTPRELFSKDRSTSDCGYDSQTGKAILSESESFQRFCAGELLALAYSAVSMLLFGSIMTSRFAEYDFRRYNLPFRMQLGLTSLFGSLMFAVTSFMSTFQFISGALTEMVSKSIVVILMCACFIMTSREIAIWNSTMEMEVHPSRHTLLNQHPTASTTRRGYGDGFAVTAGVVFLQKSGGDRREERGFNFSEHCLTNGISINCNDQFINDDKTIVYISERIGSARIFLSRSGDPHPKQLHTAAESLFHDRPAVKNGCLYFISAHKPPDKPFTRWLSMTRWPSGLRRTDLWITAAGAPLLHPCSSPAAEGVFGQIVNFPAELRRSDSLGDGGGGGGNTFSFIGIQWGVKSGGGIGIIVGIIIGVGVAIYDFASGYQRHPQCHRGSTASPPMVSPARSSCSRFGDLEIFV
ncbi:hypothetical protein C2S51_036003 [Perilla frutescens var. frutescens]|nr:hypothetical protein C2S51_036003 [Perilla frutescens var. frutescens]